MEAYKCIIDVTNRYTMEIHAEIEEDAGKQARNLDSHQIEAGGNFKETVSTEVVDIELMYPPDEEDVVIEPEQDFVDLGSLKGIEEGEE